MKLEKRKSGLLRVCTECDVGKDLLICAYIKHVKLFANSSNHCVKDFFIETWFLLGFYELSNDRFYGRFGESYRSYHHQAVEGCIKSQKIADYFRRQ
jgi:hypothetical protein